MPVEDYNLGIFVPNPNSILLSTKKGIGLLPDDETYDLDIIMHINSVFVILWQMGVGPEKEPFSITGDTEEWDDFIRGHPIGMVKSYMIAKVGYMFDTPSTGPSSSAREKVIDELEWRLSVAGEENKLVDGL